MQKEQTVKKEEQTEMPDRKTVLKEALQRLNSLIGLETIKREIESLIIEMQGRKKLEKESGRKASSSSYHMLFSGDAGTGKTEVARIISQIMYGANVTRTNTFIEVDRSQIVGQYIGHTEANMKKLLNDAKGGVLFIDEAYALAGEDNDFGREAINILIKAMEDKRDDLIIILAGYRADMKKLLNMNEGLRSRIPFHFVFPNYTPAELTQIIVRILRGRGFDCFDVLKEIKDGVTKEARRGSVEGNGRWARNKAERMMKKHYIRIGRGDAGVQAGVITPEEVAAAFQGAMTGRTEDKEGLLAIQEEALQELHNLIGLEQLKVEMERVMNFVAIEKKREQLGLSTDPVSMHMIFSGPPGTGKTTVARIVGKYLYGLGVLPSSTFLEVDRSDLVGRYIGESEKKTMEVIEKADGGVLFIDEAYALASSNQDFGAQVIHTLIKEMEDRRDRLVVILAGYKDEMEQLLQMNPGFISRVPHHLDFPDYSGEELYKIALLLLKKHHFELDEDVPSLLQQAIVRAKVRDEVEGNGRWVRNMIDRIRMEQSNRLVKERSTDFQQIRAEDVQKAFQR